MSSSDLAAVVREAVAGALAQSLQQIAQQGIGSVMTHPQADPALTAEEAAAYARCHVKTILADARAGLLEVCQRSEGGPVRVRLSALNRYLDKQRREVPGASKRPSEEINWSL